MSSYLHLIPEINIDGVWKPISIFGVDPKKGPNFLVYQGTMRDVLCSAYNHRGDLVRPGELTEEELSFLKFKYDDYECDWTNMAYTITYEDLEKEIKDAENEMYAYVDRAITEYSDAIKTVETAKIATINTGNRIPDWMIDDLDETRQNVRGVFTDDHGYADDLSALRTLTSILFAMGQLYNESWTNKLRYIYVID